MPKVSVILPTYNRAEYLDRAIQSVLNQTYTNFELIIIDDGSNDNTDQIVDSFSDDRIKYIKHSTNKGAASARNTGLEQAKGKYIAFQDSDDKWLPEKLDKQVNILSNQSEKVGIIYHNMKSFNNKHLWRPIHLRPEDGLCYKDFALNFIDTKWGIGLPTTLIRAICFDKIGYFDPKVKGGIDKELYLRLSKHYYFYHLDKILVNFSYQLSNSVRTKTYQQIKGLIIMLRKNNEFISKYPQAYAKINYHIGYWLNLLERYREASFYLNRAFEIKPNNFRYAITSLINKFFPGLLNRLLKIKNYKLDL